MNRGSAVVVKAETIYDRLIALEPEKARSGITRLRPRSDGADFDKAKAETQQSVRNLRVFIEAGGKTDRVGEFESEGTHGQFVTIGRCLG